MSLNTAENLSRALEGAQLLSLNTAENLCRALEAAQLLSLNNAENLRSCPGSLLSLYGPTGPAAIELIIIIIKKKSAEQG